MIKNQNCCICEIFFVILHQIWLIIVKTTAHLQWNMAKQEVNYNQTMKNSQTIIRSVITVAVLATLYLLIRRLSGVLLPVLISFVVAYMLAPIVNFFQHKCRLKNRVLSVIITILLVFGILTGTVAALVPAISKQATSLSNSVKTYVAQWNGNEYLSSETNQRIEELMYSLDIKSLLQSDEVQQGLRKIANFLGDGLLAIGNSVLSLAIVFVCIMYIIFLLIDYEKITLNWNKYIPARFSDSMQMLLHDLDRNMNA